MSGSSKTPIYGPEPWATTNKTAWSYWDLWFCVVALADHDGDLDQLTVAIEEGGRLSGGGTAEGKLSHLDDLKRRMAQAGIDAQTLVAGEDTDPKIRAKARAKVLKQGLYPRDMTEPMWHPPRERLYERALHGRWSLFPVSPKPFYERLCNGLGEGFRSKGQTFKLARRLEAAIERIDRTTANSAAERLAARRALVAWCYRAMERCDDSYGVISARRADRLRDALLRARGHRWRGLVRGSLRAAGLGGLGPASPPRDQAVHPAPRPTRRTCRAVHALARRRATRQPSRLPGVMSVEVV